MKLKIVIAKQVILLLAALVAGLILKGDLAEGPRMLHRLVGSLAGLVSLVGLVMLVVRKAPRTQILLGTAATILSFIAGLAGMALKTTANYSSTFNLMRGSGTLAFLAAGALLVLVIRNSGTTAPSQHITTASRV